MSDGQYIVEQTNWLKADLKQANDNRARRPWVIALGHHPQYCSNSPRDDCTKSDSKVRAGQVHVHQMYINIEYLLSIRLQNKPLLTQLLIPAVKKNSIDNDYRLFVTVTNLLAKSSNLRILKNNTQDILYQSFFCSIFDLENNNLNVNLTSLKIFQSKHLFAS